MSGKQAQDDGEWEDVEDHEEDEEEDEDTTLTNPTVVDKYKRAATWANEVLKELVAAIKPGAEVVSLCAMGDDLIFKKVAKLFRGVEKGIAFPTCISVNHCVCHNSPSAEEDTLKQKIAEGDVVHVDLGIHVDGYVAVVAHTVVVTADGKLPDNKKGNVVLAAYTALSTAVRKLRPGCSTSDVTEVIEKVAEHFKVQCVEGVLSHQLKRYIIDGFRCIPGKKSTDHAVHEYPFEEHQVWTLDVVLSTGKGKLREENVRTSIYKAALECDYQVKLESARELKKEIDSRFQTFPFALRNVHYKKARLGLTEMIKHGAVVPYPVLFEREDNAVGHFKMTVLVMPKKLERVTGIPAQEPTKPAEPFTDPLLLETQKLPFALGAKKGAAKPAEAS